MWLSVRVADLTARGPAFKSLGNILVMEICKHLRRSSQSCVMCLSWFVLSYSIVGKPDPSVYSTAFICSFIHLFVRSFVRDLLTEQAYDSLLLFSRCSNLQLLSSGMHNSLFLTSHLLAESLLPLVLLPNILPSNISRSIPSHPFILTHNIVFSLSVFLDHV